MASIGKSSGLILIVAISCLALLAVKSVTAQSVPVPEFTVKYVPSSYNTTDPYTDVSQQVDNSSIVVSIKNEPLYYQGQQAIIYYNVTTKGHFEADWTYILPNAQNLGNGPLYHLPQSLETNYGLASSNSSYSEISIPANRYDPNSKIDFAVQELELNSSQVMVYPPDGRGYPSNETVYYLVGTSDISAIQTITIPASSTSASPSPTPTVPELPMIAIAPLFLSMLTIALILKHRKIASLT
ncbi:MAG: hypothetical protein ABSG33_03975 [Candidatus Bathyarchaeia archaeon]|jgi:hypothetical protein